MWTWHFKLFTHHMKSKQKLLLSKVETLKKICKDREIDFCWLPTWFLLIGQLSSLICTRHWILENHGATFASLCESVQEFVVCWMITLNIVVFLLSAAVSQLELLHLVLEYFINASSCSQTQSHQTRAGKRDWNWFLQQHHTTTPSSATTTASGWATAAAERARGWCNSSWSAWCRNDN